VKKATWLRRPLQRCRPQDQMPQPPAAQTYPPQGRVRLSLNHALSGILRASVRHAEASITRLGASVDVTDARNGSAHMCFQTARTATQDQSVDDHHILGCGGVEPDQRFLHRRASVGLASAATSTMGNSARPQTKRTFTCASPSARDERHRTRRLRPATIDRTSTR
jgi:hypothetical protein